MDLDGYVIDDHPLGKSGIFVEDMDGLRANTFWRKRPSIYMPRWASRITLEITDVRVERLRDISEADAKSEGVRCGIDCPDHRIAFGRLWESINGHGSWESNPFVWCLSFRRID